MGGRDRIEGIEKREFNGVQLLSGSKHYYGLSRGLSDKEPTCNARDMGPIPGSGRSLGERNGNPL